MTCEDGPVLPEPYNERVRALFQDPRHAVDAPPGIGRRYTAHASESASGAQLELLAVMTDRTLAALRFRVFGCPHLIAAAEACCGDFEGGPVSQLRDFSVFDLMERLGVPVEKTGRILLLEDAVRSLRSQMDGTATDGN